jgi:hypothetical protein
MKTKSAPVEGEVVETALVPAPAQGVQLARKQTAATLAMAVNDNVDADDTRGKQKIDTKDMILPRLALAQKTSHELDPDKADKYLPDLKLYDMFNTLTGEIYGRGPIRGVIVRQLPIRAMEFDPVTNKVVKFDVPLDSKDLEFTEGPNGQRVPPKATKFYEYLVLLENGDLVVLSLKKTQVAVARKLNSLIAYRQGPIWGGVYKFSSGSMQAGANTVATFIITTGGPTPDDTMGKAEGWFEQTEGATIDTERESPNAEKDPDDIPFSWLLPVMLPLTGLLGAASLLA